MAVRTTPKTYSSRLPATAIDGSRLLASAGEMVLRVRAGRQEPRLVRIRSPKCTVGSAPGCTLRLRGAGVGRLQCWILRGPTASIVRRLHGPATLNGARFEEAALKVGDRLQVGRVELEIVECSRPAPEIESPLPPPALDTAHIASLQSQLDEALEQ